MSEAPARAAQRAGLADRVGREVVVQQEALVGDPGQRFDQLLVGRGAERAGDQRLGLAAGEDRRAVRPRQPAGLGRDRADRGRAAAVEPHPVVDDPRAHGAADQLVPGLAQLVLAPFELARQRREDLGPERRHRGAPLRLAGQRQGHGEAAGGGLGDAARERLVRDRRGERAPFLPGGGPHPVERGGGLAAPGVGAGKRFEHQLLGRLVGLALDHHQAVRPRGDGQVEVGDRAHGPRREEVPRAVGVRDPHAGQGAVPRDVRQVQGGRGAEDGEGLRVDLRVRREHGQQHLDLVEEAVRELRPDAAVGQPRGQDLGVGDPPLPALERAGDPPRRGEPFAVLDGQREEPLPRLRLLGRDGGRQQHRVAVAQHDRAVGLAGDPPGLQHDRSGRGVDRLAMHGVSRSGRSGYNTGPPPRRKPFRSPPVPESPCPRLSRPSCARARSR